MAEVFTVHGNKAVFVPVHWDGPPLRVSCKGSTLYFKSTSTVSTSSYDNTILSGASRLITSSIWVVSGGTSQVVAQEAPGPEQLHLNAKGAYFYQAANDDDEMRTPSVFIVGDAPSFDLYRTNPGRWAALDNIFASNLGGAGRRAHIGHGIAIPMVNDPADLTFRRSNGTASGNFTTEYSTGTITIEQGTKTVTGSGTAWLANVLADRVLRTPGTGGDDNHIESVDSDTQLTLEEPFAGDSVQAATYVIGTTGFPFGVNGDGTGLYPVYSGSVIGNLGAVGMVPTGSFQAQSGRLGFQSQEDIDLQTLDATLASTWTAGDTTISLVQDPSGVPQTGTLFADGSALPAKPFRTQGEVLISKDNGGTAVVAYSGYSTSQNKLLGCVDISASGTASAGKRVRQTRSHAGGQINLTTTPSTTNIQLKGMIVQNDGSVLSGPAITQAGTQNSFFQVRGGRLRVQTVAEPSALTATVVGSAGTTEYNYYVVGKDAYTSTSQALKVNITNAPNALSTSNYVRLAWTAPAGWTRYDVLRVPATSGTDSGTVVSIAENVSPWKTSQARQGRAVDYGQAAVSNPYTKPTRNTSGDILADGQITPTGGTSAASTINTFYTGANAPDSTTAGTDTTPVAGTVYFSSVLLPVNVTLTGLAIFNGSAVGTDKWIVTLYDNNGAVVANSTTAGTTATGTNQFQRVAFTSTYDATGPGKFFASISCNGTTARFRSHAAGNHITGSAAGVFGTLATINPGSGFTADKGPYLCTY